MCVWGRGSQECGFRNVKDAMVKNVGNWGFNPCVRKIPGEGNGYLCQYSCLENSQRSLAGRSPWSCNESDMTENLTLSLQTFGCSG